MNILMISESFFPADPRVKNEADLLTKNKHNIIVIALRAKNETKIEIIDGIKVYRIPKIEIFKNDKRSEIKKSNILNKFITIFMAILGYGLEYAYFTICSFILSMYILATHKFDVIHTHNPPDTLFMVALFYKILLNKQFIYDHHDLSPDLYLEKYHQKGKLIYKILLWLEKLSCKSSDLIITTNNSYKLIEVDRCNVNPNKIFVVRNGPDLNKIKIAEPIKEIRDTKNTIIGYLGTINYQDGVQYLLKIIHILVFNYNFKNIQFLIIGDGDYFKTIKMRANELKINNFIIFAGWITDRDLLNRYLSSVDIFIDSAQKSFLNDNSTFIKHMEYMVFNKPVISFNLKESVFSLQDAGIFIEPDNTEQMARTILELIQNFPLREKLGRNAKRRVSQISWDKVNAPLLNAYNLLQNKNIQK